MLVHKFQDQAELITLKLERFFMWPKRTFKIKNPGKKKNNNSEDCRMKTLDK